MKFSKMKSLLEETTNIKNLISDVIIYNGVPKPKKMPHHLVFVIKGCKLHESPFILLSEPEKSIEKSCF